MNRRKAKKGKASHFKYFQREAHKGSSLFYFVQKNEFNIFVGRSRCGGTHEAPGTAKRFDRIRLSEFLSLSCCTEVGFFLLIALFICIPLGSFVYSVLVLTYLLGSETPPSL